MTDHMIGLTTVRRAHACEMYIISDLLRRLGQYRYGSFFLPIGRSVNSYVRDCQLAIFRAPFSMVFAIRRSCTRVLLRVELRM